MLNKISSLLNNSLLRNALKLSSSNIILYLLPLIVTPILSRIYTPDSFGGWGIFSSTVVIITVILFGGYEYVIVKSNQSELKNVAHLCAIAGICVILLLFIGFKLGDLLDIDFFTSFPSQNLLFIYLLVSIVLVSCQNYANRTERYTFLASSFLILGLAQASLRILFGYIHVDTNGLILGTVLAQIVTAFYLLFRLRDKVKVFFSPVNLLEIKKTALKYRSFPLFDAPASLLAFGAFNLPIIILSFYYSRADIGCFSIIIQLLLLPMSFIGAAIGKVYYQQIASADNDPHIIQNKSLGILKLLSYISIIPAAFLLCGGNILVVFFLGNQWHLAGQVALCLSIWSIPTILSQPLLPIYRNLDLQKRTLWYNGSYFVSGIGAIFIGCELGLSLMLTLTIFTICCFCSKFLLVFDIIRITKVPLNKLPISSYILLVVILILWIVRIQA